MNPYLSLVYKKPGQTPLEAVTEAKNTNPLWSHLPVTYAGRLDPLAEGALVLLAGEECLKKDTYNALSKEYVVTMLLGFATDTYDSMGLVEDFVPEDMYNGEEFLQGLMPVYPQYTGRIRQSYPPYSSRTVLGKPLFAWAREGRLDEITIPAHDVSVESIEQIETGEISRDALQKKIREDIGRVSGDFRQKEILERWDTILASYTNFVFKTVTLKIVCGSGVYVRALVHEIGKTSGVPSLALRIVRTKVGEYTVPYK